MGERERMGRFSARAGTSRWMTPRSAQVIADDQVNRAVNDPTC